MLLQKKLMVRYEMHCHVLIGKFCEGDILQKVIQNLNILDHDYYFKLVDMMVENKIHDALLLFAEILSKGLIGNFLFLVWLSFEKSMMSKDERTLQIMDYSNDLKQKFTKQANVIDAQDITQILIIVRNRKLQIKSKSAFTN